MVEFRRKTPGIAQSYTYDIRLGPLEDIVKRMLNNSTSASSLALILYYTICTYKFVCIYILYVQYRGLTKYKMKRKMHLDWRGGIDEGRKIVIVERISHQVIERNIKLRQACKFAFSPF